MHIERAAAGLLFLVLAFRLSPSDNARAAVQDNGTLRLRTETRLVQIDVTVRDSKGKPVEDLTKSDFTVTDNGKPRSFTIFNVNGDRSPASAPSDAEAVKPAVLPVRPTLPPNTFTNTSSSPPPEGHSTIILLDGISTCLDTSVWARQGVVGLMTKVPSDERIAIYVLQKGDGLGLLQDYTTDRTRLSDAVDHFIPRGLVGCILGVEGSEDMNEFHNVKSPPKRAPGPGGPPPPNASQATSRERSEEIQRTSEAVRLSLQALAEKLRLLPGRKNVFWVTRGFPPVQLRDMNKMAWEKTFAALNDANIAVNTVDDNTLFGPPRGFAGAISMMQQVAEETGGQAYFHRNDLDVAMASGIADSRHSYTLGFYLTEIDGNYHDLKVHVDRPGLELNYRRGYLAQTETVRDVSARKSDLAAALFNPQDATGLGITASLDVTPGKPRSMLNAHLRLDPAALSLRQSPGGWMGKVEEMFIELNAEGHEVARISETKQFQIDAAYKQTFDIQGGKLTQAIELAPGAVKLSIVVRDMASGRVGSLTIPLEKLVQGIGK
jgi:VWFA-related protein